MTGGTFVDRVRGWLEGDESPSPKPPPPAPPRSGVLPGEVERRLRTLLAQPQLLGAGRVHMFNLDRLRERLGDRWPTVRERAHAAAERTLLRHLQPHDVFFRSAEDEYILVFATTSQDAAKLLCAKIVEELHRLFLGDGDLQEIRIATAVGTVDGELLFQEASLSDVFAQIRGATGASPDPAAASVSGSGADDPALVKSASPGARGGNGAASMTEHIKSLYRPVWDVERRVISTYMYTPVRQFPDGSAAEGPSALESITSPERLVAINTAALNEAVATLDELFRNKFRLLLSIPVCFETLAVRRSRQDYLAVCGTIPDYLKRFILFEFLRFNPDVPNGRITDLVTDLRPFCQGCILRVGLRQPRFAALVGTGLSGVSAVVPADRNAEARTMEDLNAFAVAAERAGLRSYALGIASTSLALAARGAGFSFIASDLVGPADDIPQHMLRFDWMDLFRRTKRN